MIRFFRSHRWAGRSLSVLSVLLLVGAAGVLGYPVYTNVIHDRHQDRLAREIAGDEIQEAYRARRLKDGDPLTRIKIPSLGVDTVVVEGISSKALKAGAGHYPGSPLPCEAGNVAIAGHRTTYGKPFGNLDQMKDGDVIILETPIGTCSYSVSKAPFVVQPSNLKVVANDPAQHLLTLTTCHPKGSDAQRLIVQATMTEGEGRPA